VVLGCAIPEGEQGFNVARVAALRAGLPDAIPGTKVHLFFSSGLQTIAQSSERIMAGFASAILAGGTESMSMVSLGSTRMAPNPLLVETHPDIYLGMGLTAENVAKEWEISREEQDAFALRSNQRAVAAIEGGRFKDQIIPLPVKLTYVDEGGTLRTHETTFATDEGPRRDTTMEVLAKLKPVFAARGTVTAGNSSQTSDGAAAVLVMEREFAESKGLRPLARFVAFAVGGVRPEVMGIGPVVAIPKVRKLANLTLADIDLIELNEAFASQVLAVTREWNFTESDFERMNVNGSGISLGHPVGATGGRILATLTREMDRRQARYGLETMCIGGGQGLAAIFERVAS
jgi:acetyl-CoA acyltransferase